MSGTEWTDQAACRDHDPELFFPVSETGPGARQAERAKAVCATCPVRQQCLDFAVSNGLGHGIFGGMTPSERRERALHRQQRHQLA